MLHTVNSKETGSTINLGITQSEAQRFFKEWFYWNINSVFDRVRHSALHP
jgi:hypothetical protein